MTNKASRNIAPARQPSPAGKQTLTAIILAAGIGRRLKSKGPKALFEIKPGFTILDYQVQLIWSLYSQADIILVTGFASEEIEQYTRNKYPVRIVVNHQHDTLGIMKSIATGLRANISNAILLLHGDLIFDPDTIRNLNTQSCLFFGQEQEHDEVGGIITDNIVTNLAYGLPLAWKQIAYITGTENILLKNLSYESHTYNWFMYEALRAIIDQNGKFAARIVKHPIFDVDSMKDLENTRKYYG